MKNKKITAFFVLSMVLCAGFIPAHGAGLLENGIDAEIEGTISKTVTLSGSLNVTDEAAKIAVLVTNSDAKNFTDKENYVYIDQIDVKESGEYSLSFSDSGLDSGDYVINMNIEGRLLTESFQNPLIRPTIQIREDGKEIKNLDYITGDIKATAELGTPMNAMFICAQYKNGVLVKAQMSECTESMQSGDILSLLIEYKGSMDVDEIKLFFWDSVNFIPITQAKVLVSVTGGKTDYPWQWNKEQGVNNWYYCTFANGEVSECQYNTEKNSWTCESSTYQAITNGGNMLPSANYDVGMVFKAPFDGIVRMTASEGQIYYPWGEAYAESDGVNLSILRNGEYEIWNTYMKYGDKPSYDVTTPVRKGEEIWFVMNCNKSSGYDDVRWKPSLTYIGNYVAEKEEGYSYYQNKNGELTELTYNEDLGYYQATDSGDYINSYTIRETDDTTFVKRYVAEEDGRYQIKGNLITKGNSADTLITIKRNSEEVWKQMIPKGELGEYDIRLRAETGDNLDVEVSVLNGKGINNSEWKSKVTNVPGPVSETKASTSQGINFDVLDEYSLNELINKSDSKLYVKKNGVKFPMVYDSASGVWKSEEDASIKLTDKNLTVTENDVIIEVCAPKDGNIKLSGDFKITGKSDGVLAKVYRNDDLVWSNRVGGERFVRWDEPFDVSYFNNELNAVASVSAGDKLIFTFNRWRLSNGDTVNFEDISISYVNGEMLSATTKWKLSQCTLKSDVNKEADIKNASAQGLNVYEGEGFLVIYPGLSTFIGYPEISEILMAIKGGELNV